AQIGASLRLSAARLQGADGRSLIADRLVVGGTLYARRLVSDGELRLPGARVTGNVDLSGAVLQSPGEDALDLTGVAVEGSVLAGRHHSVLGATFTARQRVRMAGARIGGDLLLGGALLHRSTILPLPERGANESRPPSLPEGGVDPGAALVADRIRVEGNLELADGARCVGTVRLPGAVVGGTLRLSGAHLSGPYPGADPGIALLGDNLDIGGVLEAWSAGHSPLTCRGALRLVAARVAGTVDLPGIRLVAPDRDALYADRLRVGGDLIARGIECDGTVRLQNAEIGMTADFSRATLRRPRHRPGVTQPPDADASSPVQVRPSLDVRAASVGKDLLFRHATATGGIRLRRSDIGKSVLLDGAVLGGPGARYALNAYGLATSELDARLAAPPEGRVLLDAARVGRLTDSATLWEPRTPGQVSIAGFVYDSLDDATPVGARERLRRMVGTSIRYAPQAFEQLAGVYRTGGQEERAEVVLIARQRERYRAAGGAARVWGLLQQATVGYGYRPGRALFWLAGLWALGGMWFSANELDPVDPARAPVWNPWLVAADTVLPVVDLGQDGSWRLVGASQGVSIALLAAGWVLATAVAAGVARVLRRP
ncbi:MAG: hypothetical protein ACRCY8_12615, partial [Dermatophilaceae bacterium]